MWVCKVRRFDHGLSLERGVETENEARENVEAALEDLWHVDVIPLEGKKCAGGLKGRK